jgi:hypothetical protein
LLAPTLVYIHIYIYNLVKIVFSLKIYLVKIASQQEISDLQCQVQVQFLELLTRRFGQAPKKTPPAVCIYMPVSCAAAATMPPDTYIDLTDRA